MGIRKKRLNEQERKRFAQHKVKRTPRQVTCRILIVCEGTKTEPNYFRAFNKKSHQSVVYDLEIHGEGVNTRQVLDKAIELREKNPNTFDSVWAVFDKDDFSDQDFNAAIQKAEANHVNCAWSNESFELWYLYHFKNITTSIPREEFYQRISSAVNESPLYKKKKVYSYKKGDPENFNIMNTYGSESDAIRWAEAKSQSYDDHRYAQHNPCTMVFKLVRQLEGFDDELNTLVVAKMNNECYS